MAKKGLGIENLMVNVFRSPILGHFFAIKSVGPG